MNIPTYSHIDEIPNVRVSGPVQKGCLVLEGGAFRGVHTEGFLDALMMSGINLSCVIGVSAGALNGMNYVSGQVGRSARINLTYRHDARYVGPGALLHSRSIIDVGFITEDRGILEPFDMDSFMSSPRRFVAVATNCLTGEPAYFEKGVTDDIMVAARASATMPVLSPAVEIDGVPYFDGACSCKVPYRWALDEGFEKIVVVRTRDRAFRREKSDNTLARHLYRDWPALIESLEGIDEQYNRDCDELERLHDEGRLFHVTPAEPISISKLEPDMERLGDLYWLGCYDCFQCLDELREYLGISEG